MDENQSEVLQRLEIIFDGFLSPDFKPISNIYFEKLIKYFSSEPEYLRAPMFVKWVVKCSELLMEDYNKVAPQVTSFCYNLCALLMTNEWMAIELKRHNLMENLMQILCTNKQRFNASAKLGLIRFTSEFSKYSLGCVALCKMGIWRHILEFCLHEPTIYVAREAREFLYDFLFKLLINSKDELTLHDILQEIVRPIHETVCCSGTTEMLVPVDDDEKWKKLESSVDLITYLLERQVESAVKVSFFKHCNTPTNDLNVAVYKLTDYTLKSYNFIKVYKCLIAINFAKLVELVWNGTDQIPADQFGQFGINFYNILRFSLKGPFETFLHCMRYNFILWHKLGDRAPKEVLIENELVCFPLMQLQIHMIPLLREFYKKMKLNELEDDPFSQNLFLKYFKIQTEQSVRISYAVRDVVISEDISPNVAVIAIKNILSIEHLFNREEAVLVFQALMHALRCISENLGTNAEDLDSTSDLAAENGNCYLATLVGMESLIKRYQITWRESIESICLVNFIVMLLERNMSTSLCVQSLKVIQLCIENFMAPNMALLIDDLNGSSLACLGPLIVRHMHDPSWEVRDSTLELINSITQISRIKFPAFQKFLMEHEIFPIVFDVARHDGESYVRASAYKCLASMVTVDLIWEHYKLTNELIEHLFKVMYNDSEGMVRMQAACTMAKIYEKCKIPAQYEDKLYSIFTYLAISDLHWEVNICALYFWKLEIYRRCTDQGMIDGTFPSVTFSKEHKKIVQLTPREINLRITKVFNELAARGCLATLYKCVTEKFELAVTRKTVMILQCLQAMLKKYDYDPVNEYASSSSRDYEESTPSEHTQNVDMQEEEVMVNADEIMNNILDDKDINYLVNACELYLQVNRPEGSIDSQHYKKYSHVHTMEFLQLLKTKNLDELLESREKWAECNESFESLVDDLWYAVKSHPDGPIADCY